ncbi:mitochondrial 18 KDa protein-domain-containing protein [Naematelia encephala]|uniref:Mitochondrial fission process protein 1 n=1 Tax=Naematelia encephala TaxID=71784 RepID=A0A1Y2AZA7_9TREE|nr:mitochondrial 18 KDa protein-domain-containing protein [Naematelia encephala]
MPTDGKASTVTTLEQRAEAEVKAATNAADGKVQDLVDSNADTTDSNMRYAAYLRRARDIVRAGSRYTAYTSDVGEAFRPVVPPYLVTAAYAISWSYLIGDVSWATYKSSQLGPSPIEAANISEPTRLALVAVKRSVFQGIASMALPAFTIHTAVKYAGRQFAKSTNTTLKRWGPTSVGLGIVPFLPYLFDEPVEHVVEATFDKLEENWFRKTTEPSAAKKDL